MKKLFYAQSAEEFTWYRQVQFNLKTNQRGYRKMKPTLHIVFVAFLMVVSTQSAKAESLTFFWNGSSLTDVSSTYSRVDVEFGAPFGNWSWLSPNGTLFNGFYNIDTSSLPGTVVDWAFSTISQGYVNTTAGVFQWNASAFTDVSPWFARVDYEWKIPSSLTSTWLQPNGFLLGTGGLNVNTTSLPGTVVDWAFLDTSYGYIQTTGGVFFWNGSTLTDVSSTYSRVDIEFGAPFGNWTWLSPDGMLFNGIYNIDTSSLPGTVVDWAFSDPNYGYIQIEIPSEPVPEPTTMLLLGSGLVAFAGSQLRRKKK